MPKKVYRNTIPTIVYHVRSADGVTITWMDSQAPATRLANAEGYEVYEVNRISGRAVRIV